MKTINNSSRRKFIGALAFGATASTISVLTNPIFANSTSFNEKNMKEVLKNVHVILEDESSLEKE